MLKSLFSFVALISIVLMIIAGTGCVKVSPKSNDQNQQYCAKYIRNGVEDNLNYKSIVRIIITRDNGNLELCSGTVIGSSLVLTAAHCVNSPQDGLVSSIRSYNSAGEEVEAQHVIIHPSYTDSADIVETGYGASGDPEYMTHVGTVDIAIIKFATNLDLTPIPLHADAIETREPLTIVGYGRNEDEINNILRFGEALYIGPMPNFSGLEDAAILTIPGTSNAIACPGDSGGPLLKEGGIVGVFSHYTYLSSGEGGVCSRTINNTYVSVAKFSSWIEETVELLEPTPDPNITPDPDVSSHSKCVKIH